MAAGVVDRLWDVADIVALVEVTEQTSAPKKRGLYRKCPPQNSKAPGCPGAK